MRHKSERRWSQVHGGDGTGCRKKVCKVISENRKMNLPREIVVPVECQAKDHGRDFKLFTLVKKEDG